MPACIVHDIKGKKIEEFDLPEIIFGGHINKAVLHQAIVMYQANLRQGNASTKERGSVSGGGKKPYRQKGTGRARAGSTRSPLWKGGGTTFGPLPRDFNYTLPKKMRDAALRASLNAKYSSDDLVCIDKLAVETDKTKDFAKTLKSLNLRGKVLALVDLADEKLTRVSRNLPFFSMIRPCDVTAYDILKSKKVLITKSAFEQLLKRVT
ncbi:MAG: 50S ribosomal protein L4 [Candidatus Omnitrophica bacterium]|nr:50S ribosomal protein L4 [Candidatus Omnitrophota bacterium]